MHALCGARLYVDACERNCTEGRGSVILYTCKKVNVSFSHLQEEMQNRKPPLSECLRRVIHRLHLTLYYRGEYLNQLVEETQGRKLLLPTEEVVFDVDPNHPIPDPMVGEPELVPSRRLFMEAVDAACDECREETRELYQREGKADQVGHWERACRACTEQNLRACERQR